MKALIGRLRTSAFVRNVAVVASGTGGAQLVTIACAPFVARLYGPNAFGVMGLFTAVLTILTPLAALSYPMAIVLPSRSSDALALVRLSVAIGVASSLLLAVLVILLRGWASDVLGLGAIEPFLLFLPVAMFLSVLLAIANQWVFRLKQFRVTAQSAVIHALIVNSVLIGVGAVFPSAAVLVTVAALGAGSHALILYAGVRHSKPWKEENAEAPGHTTSVGLTPSTVAGKYLDFALYRTPQIVLNAASQGIPVMMLAAFFGAAAAGFYTLGRLVLAAPTTLIGQSVSSVFYPRFNEAFNTGENTYDLLRTATLSLALVGVVPFGLVVALGPWIFATVFGDQWETAGVYSQWLALWLYVAFVNRPSVGAIPVLSLQGLFLLYEIMSVVLRAAALMIGFYMFTSGLVAIAAFSLVGVVLNIVLVSVTLNAARRIRSVKHDHD